MKINTINYLYRHATGLTSTPVTMQLFKKFIIIINFGLPFKNRHGICKFIRFMISEFQQKKTHLAFSYFLFFHFSFIYLLMYTGRRDGGMYVNRKFQLQRLITGKLRD